MVNKQDDEILGMIGRSYKASALQTAAGSFASLIAGQMDYSTARTEASNLNVQASNLELQAQQQANMLREQFINAIGSYQMNAAQRGVDVGSMSVQDNIENSAIAVGKDIQTMNQNASIQASSLRAQSRAIKRNAIVKRNLGYVNTATDLFSSYSMYTIGNGLTKKAG